MFRHKTVCTLNQTIKFIYSAVKLLLLIQIGSFNLSVESVKDLFTGFKGQCVRITLNIFKSLQLIRIKLNILLTWEYDVHKSMAFKKKKLELYEHKVP
jgi:hypothetical protein